MSFQLAFYYFISLMATLYLEAMPSNAQTGKMEKWVVEQNSSLSVKGKTNINNFTCSIREYASKDTIICYDDAAKDIIFRGEIVMDILSFDCQSSMVTKDLRKILKADEFPKMTIRFISLQYMPLLQNKAERVKGWVEVQLAGVTKRFELCYSFIQSGPGYLQMNGGRSFLFSDFNLSAPSKFGGLIKIKNAFDVQFQLLLRTI